MTPLPAIPENAWCRKCGYALRGLPRFVCPECGKEFDPADPRTFSARAPGWRRKRWIQRVVVTAGALAVLAVTAPRGLMESSIAFTCADCGHVTRTKRLELRPPTWIPCRYPGITLTGVQEGQSPHDPGQHGAYKADVKSDLFCRGRVTAWADCSRDDPCSFNGILVTPEAVPTFLFEMLSPENNGIGP